MTYRRKLELLRQIEDNNTSDGLTPDDRMLGIQEAVRELRKLIEDNAADLIEGDFAVKFYWAEGNLDTGEKYDDVMDFSEELHTFLEEHGAARVQVYGPDGDLIPRTE